MGQVIPDGFGQATLLFDFISGPSNPINVVFGYQNGDDQGAGANAGIIGDEFASNVMVGGYINDNVLFLGVEVLQNPGAVSASVSQNVAGGDVSQGFPPQVAYLMKKATGGGGRSGRGRLYMPGVTVAGAGESGVLVSAAITQLNSSFAGLISNMESNSIPMVLLHAEPSALAPNIVLTLTADSLVATQRRRLRG